MLELLSLPEDELRNLLDQHGISHSDCQDRTDLIVTVQAEVASGHRKFLPTEQSSGDSDSEEYFRVHHNIG